MADADHIGAAASGKVLSLVTFQVGQEVFAVPIEQVREVGRVLPITRVPHAPPYVVGVINLRGRIVPVIDMHARLGRVKIEDQALRPRMLVSDVREEMPVAFLVDSVQSILRIAAERMRPPPEMAVIDVVYIQGVITMENAIIVVLDARRILDAAETAQLPALGAGAHG